MVITLDGPAGSGKSTVAKVLAQKLSMNQIDSGALYRSYTYVAMVYAKAHNKNIAEVIHTEDFKKHLLAQDLQIMFESGKQVIQWNNQNMELFIRSPEITENIKFVADPRYVREEVNRRIANLAENYSVIADGRDMGTVVFPNADFKFFMTADLEIRAARRLEEFRCKNPQITLEQVVEEIDKRDRDDQNREFGRLQPAQDAIFVDTTNLELNGVVNVIVNIIQNKQRS